MHNEDSFVLALAGLLHDVGKFMFRADESGLKLWDGDVQADFKYKHAMLSASFVSQFVPEPWRAKIRGPVSNHHRPTTQTERIIQLADWLAAGERDDDPEEDLPKASKQQLTVFSAISLNGQHLGTHRIKNAFLPLRPLTMTKEALFPGPALSEEALNKAYRELWEAFASAAKALGDAHQGNGNIAVYLESLQLIFQHFLWSVPSAYWGRHPDISLYDHSRMTGALAATLAELKSEEVDALLDADIRTSSDNVALLIGGDISGVQQFIYTITNRGATHALRGRSFYLQLLTEAIARYILRELDLPITNLIYQGGGDFTILARASDTEKLKAIQQRISHILLQHHRGELYVALASVPLAAKDFFDGRLKERWSALAEAQQVIKRRRFAELDEAALKWLFHPMGHGGNEEKQCQVCGREHPGTIDVEREDGSTVRKCPPCRSYEALGKDLRKARYLALEWLPIHETPKPDPKAAPGSYPDVLAAFGMRAHVLKTANGTPTTAHPITLLAIKDEALKALRPEAKIAVGRRFLVNVTPQKEDGIKTFEELAEDARGIKRLGVLRMDVDNLGRLFAEGLGDRSTLSRMAGLSFAVSLYFEGWVEQIAETMNREAGKDVLYSIYSGGDDLFFVGSWDWIVRFAQRVRKDLSEYTAGHPAITASAGIILAGSKYPLAQAAAEAGEAEHAAKGRQRWDDTEKRMVTAKDAVSFLGQVQSWRQFGLDWEPGMETVAGLAALLSEMIDKGTPKSLIRKLSRLYTQYEVEERRRQEVGEDETQTGAPQPLWGPWMWRGFYLLRRSKDTDVQQLADMLHDDEFRQMAWIGLAARWAELSIR